MTSTFPSIPDSEAFSATRDALHAYSRILGDWAVSARERRKHWWHGSLRPALHGLSSGVLRAAIDIELVLDVSTSRLIVHTAAGDMLAQSLHGQPAFDVAQTVRAFLGQHGVDPARMPALRDDAAQHRAHANYHPDDARIIGAVWRVVFSELERFRNAIREETSPLQLWPHHFDISMLWLPGTRLPEHDPADEENADKQMNIGFTFGDEGIQQPYFYVTAYPLPDALAAMPLPHGAYWHTASFTGAALLYDTLQTQSDPANCLHALWRAMLHAGREHLSAPS